MIANEAPGEIVRLGVDDEVSVLWLNQRGKNLHIDGVFQRWREALWECLQDRLEREYPIRDYTRVIGKPDLSAYDPEAIRNIRDIVYNYRELITSDKWTEIESELTEVEGFILVDEKTTEIEQELGNIVKEDSLLKELASKLAEVKPILDKMENEVKSKQEENKKKERRRREEREEEEEEAEGKT